MIQMNDPQRITLYRKEFGLDSILNEFLVGHLSLYRFEAHETIYYENSPVNKFYLLVKGRLRCAHYQSGGTLAVVAMMNPFAALGDVEIINDRLTTTAVVATEETELLGIPAEMVRTHAGEDPRFLCFLIESLVAKLNNSTSLRLGHLMPVKSRLALYLLSHPSTGGIRDIVILPEKENLASMLGTTYRHLNRVLNELAREGLIGQGYPGVALNCREDLSRLIEE